MSDAGAGPATRWLDAARAPLLVALVLGLAASISLAQITLTVLAVWVVLARRAGRAAPLRWPLLLPVLAFVAWSLIAALGAPRPRESLLACKGLLTLGALFVIVNALPDAAAARRFATWLLVAVTATAALALVQVSACPDVAFTAPAVTLIGKFFRKCGRARGLFSIYMTLAGVLAIVLTATLPRLARLGRDLRWLGPAFVLNGVAMALTYVRGAWLGFVAGALAAVAGLGRRGAVAAGAVALLGALVLLSLPHVRDRAGTIGDPTNDTTRDRMAMLEVGLRLAAEHPWIGIGPGQLKRAYPALAPPEAMRRSTSHLHDSPLQIAAERGVIGLAAWLWIFVAFFRRARVVLARLPAAAADDRALVLGSLAAIVTFLVAGLFEYNFGDTEVLMVALAMMALPFAVAGGRVSTDPCAAA